MNVIESLFGQDYSVWQYDSRNLSQGLNPTQPQSTLEFKFKDIKFEEKKEEKEKEKEKLELKDLSKEEIDNISSLLPEIKLEKEEDLLFREKSLEPPIKGNKIEQEFPPKLDKVQPTPPTVDETKKEVIFEVLNVNPLNRNEIYQNFFFIAFNEQVTPLSSTEETNFFPTFETFPSFEYTLLWQTPKLLKIEKKDGNFQKATKFTVTLKKFKNSIGSLKNDFTFEFNTSVPHIIYSVPGNCQVNEIPIGYVEFDQDIDVDDAFSKAKLTDGGILSLQWSNYEIKRITIDEAKKALTDKRYINIKSALEANIKNYNPKRGFFWTTIQPLEKGNKYYFKFASGLKSNEGTLETREVQGYYFQVIRDFIAKIHNSNYHSTSFNIHFNYTLYLNVIKDDMIKVKQTIDVKYQIYPNSIMVIGEFIPNTNYEFEFDSNIIDIFGRKLTTKSVILKNGSSGTAFYSPYSNIITLDSSKGDCVIPFYSRNLFEFHIVIFQVDPKKDYDYSPFGRLYKYPNYGNSILTSLKNIGKIVYDENIKLNTKKDVLEETKINLSKFLKNNIGHLFVYFSGYNSESYCWIQSTNISIDTFITNSKFIIWPNKINDGSIINDLEVSYIMENKGQYPNDQERKLAQNEKGFCEIETSTNATIRIYAKSGDDLIFLHSQMNKDHENPYRMHVFDDRKLYQPKESINIKGYVRKFVEKDGEIQYQIPDDFELPYHVVDSIGSSYLESKTNVKHGSFDFSFKIPDNVNLGSSTIFFDHNQYVHRHSFSVEEFRTPEFEVSINKENSTDITLNTPIRLNGKATYFNGGCIDDSNAAWELNSSQGSYFPPGWNNFIFSNDVSIQTGQSNHNTKTNQYGESLIDITVTNKNPILVPINIFTKLKVNDINGLVQESSQTILVHPCSLYIGCKRNNHFSILKEEVSFDFIVTDINGNSQEKVKFTVDINSIYYERIGYQYIQKEKTIKSFDVESQKEQITVKHSFDEGGTYMIRAKVKDSNGLENMVSFNYYVSGASKLYIPSTLEIDSISLIKDKEIYNIGDTAEIFIQCSKELSSNRALIMILCGDHISTEEILLKDSNYIEKIKITKAFLPNSLIVVYIIGESKKESYYASSFIELKVSTLIHSLNIELKTNSYEYKPGSEFELDILVKDSNDQPLKDSEITLMLIDEAVLSLAGYTLSNPLDFFYKARNYQWYGKSIRESLITSNLKDLLYKYNNGGRIYGAPLKGFSIIDKLKNLEKLQDQNLFMDQCECDDEDLSLDEKSAKPKSLRFLGGLQSSKRSESTPETIEKKKSISVRTKFDPNGSFVSLIKTDENGKINHKFKLPESLTKYRIIAIATNDIGTSFGIKESYVATTLPFQVRPTIPRFLNVGDVKIKVPIVFQNQTDESMIINVLFKTINLKLNQTSYKFTIPSKQRLVIPFTVHTIAPGKAYFQIAAISEDGKYQDAFEKNIQVYTPATPSAVAMYKEIDDDDVVFHQISTPQNTFEQYGGLEITTSSTALQVLTDAFIYIYDYNLESSELFASQLISILSLKDILKEFKEKNTPKETEIEDFISKLIDQFKKSQKSDGGWSNWSPLLPTDPFLSGIIIYSLIIAKKSGYDVPKEMYDKGYQYICNIESNWIFLLGMLILPVHIKNTIRALCYYVESLINSNSNLLTKCKKMFDDVSKSKKIYPDGLAWLMIAIYNCDSKSIMISTILSDLKSMIHETPKTANYITHMTEQEKQIFLHSDKRTDAIVLEAFITVDPKNYLIQKLVKGLLEGQKRGRWNSTQENTFIIVALKKYFDIYEKQTPDYITQLWFDKFYIGEQEFKGRSVDFKNISIPMNFLQQQEKLNNVIISKKGKGRLYYRIGMKSSSKDLKSNPENYGFVVSREYSYSQNKDDVVKDKDGIIRIKAGSEVKIILKLIVQSKRYNVALIDKVPAGLEPTKTKQRSSNDSNNFNRYYDSYQWFQHKNLRTERVEVMTNILPPGIYYFTYFAKAIFQGEFVVPPCYAEEIYSPELYGRSHSNNVIIE